MLDHPVILIIVVVATFLRWFMQKSDGTKEDPQRPVVPDQPIPRGGEPQTEEERIRRFLEALGQPPGSAPPPKVAPKPKVRPRVFPLPPLTTVPPPLASAPASPAKAAPAPPVAQRVFTPAVAQEGSFEVRDLGAQSPNAPSATRPRVVAEEQGLMAKLRTSQGLRSAIILREILGPPRSLQPLETRGTALM